MSEKKLIGQRRYEPTGEVRSPKKGEWFLSEEYGHIAYADKGYEGEHGPILRLVEDFTEVERPSADAIALARAIRFGNKHVPPSPETLAIADSVLSAAAAFTTAADEFYPPAEPPGPDPQDLAFAQKCADLNKPRPVDASDAVAMANLCNEYHAQYHTPDLKCPLCMKMVDILKRSEASHA